MVCGWPNVIWSVSVPNSDNLPVAVVYDREDARRFLTQTPLCRCCLALTPNAFAELKEAAVPVLRLGDYVDDAVHSDMVGQAAALSEQLIRTTAQDRILGPAAAETLVNGSHPLISLVMLLRVVFKDQTGPWCLPEANGWHTVTDSREAARCFLSLVLAGDHFHQGPLKLHPLSWLIAALNAVTTRVAGRRAIIIQAPRYGLANLVLKARSQGMNTLALRANVGGWRDLVYSLRALWHGLRGAALVEMVVSPTSVDKGMLSHCRTLLEQSCTCPWLRAVAAPGLERLARQAVLTQALVSPMARLLRPHRGARLILHSMRWLDEAALAQAGGQCEIRRSLISHGTHAVGADAVSAQEAAINARGLLVSPLADETVTQSPLAADLARQLAPDLPQRAFRPIMWGYKTMPPAQNRNDRSLRILHAGTYKPFTAVRPFLYETADEYVQGLVALVDAVGQCRGARLAIRLRGGRECDRMALERLLPANGCWEISTVPAFLDDLAQSDLLVSFSSTTIEEALAGRRPVLLWGGSGRYRHVSAHTQRPQGSNRAAVYAVENADQLPAMVVAILESHQDGPLSDEELSAYHWPPQTDGVDEFIAAP